MSHSPSQSLSQHSLSTYYAPGSSLPHGQETPVTDWEERSDGQTSAIKLSKTMAQRGSFTFLRSQSKKSAAAELGLSIFWLPSSRSLYYYYIYRFQPVCPSGNSLLLGPVSFLGSLGSELYPPVFQLFSAYRVLISWSNSLLCAKVLMGTLMSCGAQIAYLHFKSSF